MRGWCKMGNSLGILVVDTYFLVATCGDGCFGLCGMCVFVLLILLIEQIAIKKAKYNLQINMR